MPGPLPHFGRFKRALAGITAAAACVAIFGTGAPAYASASGATRYVDCSASGQGDGSRAHPWASLRPADAVQYGPGDQLLLRRGTACTGRFAATGSGTAAAPITLGAYGSGARPTINGAGTPNGTGAVQLTDQQYWTIQDLHVTNATRSKTPKSYRSGVLVLNSGVGRIHGITIRGLTVDSVRSSAADGILGPRDWGGISALTYGDHGDGFDGLRITGNQVKNVSRSGIVVSNHHYPASADRSVRVDHNAVTRARGDSIFVLGSRGARIDHNTSRDGGNILPCPECGKDTRKTASVGIWTTQADRTVIEYNEVSGEYTGAGDGEGFDVDVSATNAVVQYNYAHDNAGGGILLCGSRNASVRFNIFQNNGKSAIAFIGSVPARNTSIYNNTIYASARSKASVVRTFNGRHGSGISFKNNVIYSYSAGTYGWPTRPHTAGNTLIGTHGSGRPTDARTLWRDPVLRHPGSGRNGIGTLSGYKPKHPSRFAHGVAIPSSVTRDFFGKRINPKSPPRGAAG